MLRALGTRRRVALLGYDALKPELAGEAASKQTGAERVSLAHSPALAHGFDNFIR
jgi:hypothetical protein